MKKLILTLICFATFILPAQAQKYYFLHSDETGDYYYEDNNPLAHRGRKFRLKDVQETTITTINTIPKPDWVVRAQALYTNGLNEVGYSGAHTNVNVSYESIGIDLLERIAAPGNPDDAALAQRWKGIIESAYTSLSKYAAAFGIESMRDFPYESDVMESPVTSTVIIFRGVTYARKDK